MRRHIAERTRLICSVLMLLAFTAYLSQAHANDLRNISKVNGGIRLEANQQAEDYDVSAMALSRSRYFCTFPVEVLSMGPNMTFLGILNPASSSRQ